MDGFKDVGAEIYNEGYQARARNEALNPSKPRPWLLGWQDAGKVIAEFATVMNAKKPASDFQKAALERLLEVAMRGTGQSEIVANFLLAWWNTEECGRFDFKQLWGVDTAIADDVLTVLRMVVEQSNYPDVLGYEKQFGRLVRLWRPALGGEQAQRIAR